ncbi:hypothetical protein CSO01_00040 [Cellulomonas soli]|uniref:Phosphoribosyltransferase domain-containing protein n=1 Tax=Cellulomonas soli TaxID=931535 RepID=A0A512P7V8_9CELL|nr:hypothetical protein CSO01_00040 [Cellulomonas soli]
MRPLRETGRGLLGLVLPVACAACGADDVAWCGPCRSLLDGPPWRCEERAGRLDRMGTRPDVPAWALADAVGPVRSLVVSWKDRGRTDVTGDLVRALAAGARLLAPELTAAVAVCPTPARLLVVPVPSTAAARRRRGADLVALLAGGVAEALDDGPGRQERGSRARALVALRRRGGRDQVGLGRRARADNLAGRVRLARGLDPAELDGVPVLLVDDILTTGATAAQCQEVLARAGAVVIGLLVLASTPPPGAPSTLAPPPVAPGSRRFGAAAAGDLDRSHDLHSGTRARTVDSAPLRR